MRISVNNFGVSARKTTKLFLVMCREVGMTIWIQLWGVHPPLKLGRAKNIQNLVQFRTTLDLLSIENRHCTFSVGS